MSQQLSSFIKDWAGKMDVELKKCIADLQAPPPLLEAMEYSLLAGGKRIRPIFLFATLDALGHDPLKGKHAACALEMVHTYSLVHDDLPAMDDDDYRRGKLTNHKVFGEAMAILAGDALLTHAFYLLAKNAEGMKPEQFVTMFQEFSLLAGPNGMVGGQAADMLGEDKKLTIDELYYIHERKTADLLTSAVRMGCYIGQASPDQVIHLTTYAKHIGLAFQIQDDILDEIGDEAKLGKKVGSDKDNDKSTFVSLLGVEGAKEQLHQHVQQSKEALAKAEVLSDRLADLADFMVQRDY
ncbi:polyprenyl synthetase family protein [Bacillus horti]|uniref:Geranylgeranyl diphosphate synthase type II n=1 Tax=Caldalkalibacillus horti TaxID=77523 RepID=A0ABT9W0Y5_9BACI|nr:farnesyl diphosphate synthase [Bacillus horti]MDQ0166871.1 geranylgeranyl diphosphate synthase type II [Bacillus horti]